MGRRLLSFACGGALLFAGMLAGTACGPRPFVSAPPPVVPESEQPLAHRPIPEPSVALLLTRSERLRSEASLTTATMAERASEPEAEEPSTSSDEDDPVSEHDDEDDVRVVVVRSGFFATPEDLLRAAVRSAEPRRPRMLNEARMLVRASGLARPCPTCDAHAGEARRAARELLSDARAEIKTCLFKVVAREPSVVIGAPTGLVIEQAMASREVVMRFTIHFDSEQGLPRIADVDGVLDQEARDCIASALGAHKPSGPFPAGSLPVVAFSQPATYISGGALNAQVSREAATLGWLHYERGDYREALAYFDDAFWVFHLAEYQMLRGLALEALGRERAAAKAYAIFIAERPSAPEVAQLRRMIAKTERAVAQR